MYDGAKREAARAARARRAKARRPRRVVAATLSEDGATWTLALACAHTTTAQRQRGVAAPPRELPCPTCESETPAS